MLVLYKKIYFFVNDTTKKNTREHSIKEINIPIYIERAFNKTHYICRAHNLFKFVSSMLKIWIYIAHRDTHVQS